MTIKDIEWALSEHCVLCKGTGYSPALLMYCHDCFGTGRLDMSNLFETLGAVRLCVAARELANEAFCRGDEKPYQFTLEEILKS